MIKKLIISRIINLSLLKEALKQLPNFEPSRESNIWTLCTWRKSNIWTICTWRKSNIWTLCTWRESNIWTLCTYRESNIGTPCTWMESNIWTLCTWRESNIGHPVPEGNLMSRQTPYFSSTTSCWHHPASSANNVFIK